MSASKETFKVDWRAETAVEQTVDLLRLYGVAYVPRFFKQVQNLRQEFKRAFAQAGSNSRIAKGTATVQQKNLAAGLGETRTGVHLKLNGFGRYRDLYPTLAEVFGLDYMQKVAYSYLGEPLTLNRHIILTHDYRASEQILPYHFDEINSLKFFLYLTETGPDVAPFELIPGTHRICRQIRLAEWLRVNSYSDIRNQVFNSFSEEFCFTFFGRFKDFLLLESVMFDGLPGTLVVFDTDCLHRGGRLKEGAERMVVRGSTYSGFWPDLDF